MRQTVVLALVIFAAFAASLPAARHLAARPLAMAMPAAMRDSMCDPQHGDVSGWQEEKTPAVTFRHPAGYSRWIIDARFQNRIMTYEGTAYGPHDIEMGWAQALDSLDYGLSRSTRQSICVAIIGGRPAFISTYSRGVKPSFAVARWNSYKGLPPVFIGIGARERNTLAEMRQIFWTAQFTGLEPDSADALRCAAIVRPRGVLADVVDTALVGMLAQNVWAAMPRGYTIFELSFDSAGTVDDVELLASDLPLAGQKEIAAIVSSNAKTQAPSSPPAAIRVEVTEKGFAYQLVPISACPKAVGAHGN